MDVSIRRWTQADAEALAALCNDADRTYLSDRMAKPYKLEHARMWIEMIQPQERGGSLFRAIEADGRVVGQISLERLSDVNACDGILGYFLRTDCWGKGIATRAVALLLREAFRLPGLLRVTGEVMEPNVASRRVLEKNGFALEGVKRSAVRKNGRVYNVCIYGRCREAERPEEETEK